MASHQGEVLQGLFVVSVSTAFLSSALRPSPELFLQCILHAHAVNPNREQIQWKKKKIVWFFNFFFLCSFSAGSVPWSGSMSGHTNICPDKMCVSKEREWEVWMQGAERRGFGLADKSINTAHVTTVSLTYLGGFLANDRGIRRFQSHSAILDSEGESLQWMHAYRHSGTNAQYDPLFPLK